MMDHVNDNRVASTRGRGRGRRGNAMILVAGILVLLVIIATAYITRTQGGRVTAAAVQQTATRITSDRVLADALAGEIAGALFPRPVDHMASLPFNSNTPRLSSSWNPQRYGIDRDILYNDLARGVTPDLDGDGVPDGDGVADFPFSFAPYWVVPFTNWPDGVTYLVNEGNPPGEPGFGDTRWLRDTEPLRWDLDEDGRPEVFRLWRHMTNIARPNNGWRLCTNIADVENSLLLDLGAPVEQWQPYRQPDIARFDPSTGNAMWDQSFFTRWNNWFYNNAAAQGDVSGFAIPPNFYELKDLINVGTPLEIDERPQDEFIGGTARWDVSRVLADADGDGFTDSFWFLVPGQAERGIRQVAAVSIVDNSALFNANVATSFWSGGDGYSRNYPGTSNGLLGTDGTAGETPADLAASGEQLYWDARSTFTPPANWNVGFFDNFQNWEGAFDVPPYFSALEMYDTGGTADVQVEWYSRADSDSRQAYLRWQDYVTALGFAGDREGLFASIFEDSPPGAPGGVLKTAIDRRRYWLAAASRPLEATSGLTPFTLADEMELRLYHGQNHPWILTRFERAVNTDDSRFALLRSGGAFEETTPYLDQLRNSELLHDNRRKVTLYSGARNEIMPPWLWWRYGADADSLPDFVRSDLLSDPDAGARWIAQSRLKLDLREQDPVTIFNLPERGQGLLHERLPWVVLHALSDEDDQGGQSYFDGAYNFNELRRVAASFTANLLAYRDLDDDAPLFDEIASTGQVGAVPLPSSVDFGSPGDKRFLGMERQPFLAEMFVAHVYRADTIPSGHPDQPADTYSDSGEFYVVGNRPDLCPQTTIVVVQIMSPFVRTDPDAPDNTCYDPIDLRDYKIRILDDPAFTFQLSGELCQATEENPASAIFYSIDRDFGGQGQAFVDKWLDFLDLREEELAPGTIVAPTGIGFVSNWPTERELFDRFAGEGRYAVELIRIDPVSGADVVIDRFGGEDSNGELFGNSQSFREDGLATLRPPPLYFASAGDPNTLGDSVYEGLRLGPTADHWVTWARVGRPFGVDWNAAPGIQPDEKAPRFVFAHQWVDTLNDAEDFADGDPRNTVQIRQFGNRFSFAIDDPDLPWFDDVVETPRLYVKFSRDPILEPIRRKPAYFTMHPSYTAIGDDVYPDFDETPYAYGLSFYGIPYPDRTSAPGAGIPDKGLEETFFAARDSTLQMLQKDDGFQQVGEILNVWLYGHELTFGGTGGTYTETERTFSEAMSEELEEELQLPNGEPRFVNRLRPGETVGVAGGSAFDPRHSVPAMPAGLRLLDAFVCDGRGQLRDFNRDGLVNADDETLWESYRFSNASGFGGGLTPGLININTAPVEVLRTLPHWSRLVHGSASLLDAASLPRIWFPRTAVAEAAIAYRDRIGNGQYVSAEGTFEHRFSNDDYATRAVDIPNDADLRQERGFASVGELQLLNLEGAQWNTLGETVWPEAWSIDFAGSLAPFSRNGSNGPPSAAVSMDVVGGFEDPQWGGDGVAGDAEEANLLFAGASNLVTTRSDVFTVYFRVRSFRQNPTTGIWDATNPEYIVDDSRYVMLVDRSAVNRPSDRPKILYLEKVPN